MAGKRLGEHVMNLGLREDEALRRMFDLLEYCRVGKVSMDETIRIEENCESFGIEGEQPTCFFTTGFLMHACMPPIGNIWIEPQDG